MTGAALDLASLFRGRRSTLNRWNGKIAKQNALARGRSAFNFPFLKEVSHNCFVSDVVNLEIEEVSQNCFVFDIVNFKN